MRKDPIGDQPFSPADAEESLGISTDDVRQLVVAVP